MFAEFDHVRIPEKDVTGVIVDIYAVKNGMIYYLVESDEEGPSNDPDSWNLRFPIFTCTADQLEKI